LVAKKNGLLAKLKLINVDMSSLEAGTISSTSNIYSTINGFVTEVNVNIGKFVNPSDILFEIVDTEHLHAELIIFEKDVRKIKIGQKVRFTLANETKERMATVYLIGREISADRTIRIHCHIDKEDKDLLPGMYLKAILETGGASVTALPDEAIIDFEGKKYVFIKTEKGHGHEEEGHEHEEGNHKDEESKENAEHKEEGQHFMMQEITVGNSELGYTEVTLSEGWNNENEVAIKGAYDILSKMKNSEEEGGHAH
jgi:cobalt-zinc-cadmium efflux system membrane fusion protein